MKNIEPIPIAVPQISFSNKALGSAITEIIPAFNIPNNKCGVVMLDGKEYLCREGTKEASCVNCEKAGDCEKIMICKSATPLCEYRCYVNHARTCGDDIWKGNRGMFALNYLASRQDDFVSQMCEKINRNIVFSDKVVYFRIHSTGEFYDDSYFDKWLEIARSFQSENIIFVAYTKRLDILYHHMGNELPDNFRILISIMPDTYYLDYVIDGRTYCGLELRNLIEELCCHYHAKKYVACYVINKENSVWFHLPTDKKNSHYCNLHEHGNCYSCKICYKDNDCNTIFAALRSSGYLARFIVDFKYMIKKKNYKIAQGMAADALNTHLIASGNADVINIFKNIADILGETSDIDSGFTYDFWQDVYDELNHISYENIVQNDAKRFRWFAKYMERKIKNGAER